MTARRKRLARGVDRNFLLGILALVVVFGGYVLSATKLVHKPFEPSTRTARAVFADAESLHTAAPVRVRGVEVGTVSKVEPTGDGRTTTVTMKLTRDAPRLGRDATAALRWRLVLGGSYQVELDPGSSPKQSGSEFLDDRHTSSQVELDQVLTAVQHDQRAGIRSTLTELPQAFSDRAAPARALSTASAVAPRLAAVAHSVRGEHPEHDLRRLLVTASKTAAALDAPSDPVRAVVEGGASTLQTIARRGSDVSAAIRTADSALPRLRNTLGELEATLDVADPTLRRLLGPAADVEPTARALRPTVLAADALLTRARPLLRRLRPAAAALGDASREARPILDGLEPTMRRLNDRILPDLALTDATSKRPTYQMLGPTVASFTAVAGKFDSYTHLGSLDGAAGDPKVDTSGCSTYFSDLKPGQLVNCETLLATIGHLLAGKPPRRSR